MFSSVVPVTYSDAQTLLLCVPKRTLKNISAPFGYLNYSPTFALSLPQLSLAMGQGQTQDINKYKPPGHFPDTFATRMRSARSPATTEHNIISREQQGKGEQRKMSVLCSLSQSFSQCCAEIWWLIIALT